MNLICNKINLLYSPLYTKKMVYALIKTAISALYKFRTMTIINTACYVRLLIENTGCITLDVACYTET
jgi:hypothetical protein